jgi:hypothetical protein
VFLVPNPPGGVWCAHISTPGPVEAEDFLYTLRAVTLHKTSEEAVGHLQELMHLHWRDYPTLWDYADYHKTKRGRAEEARRVARELYKQLSQRAKRGQELWAAECTTDNVLQVALWCTQVEGGKSHG